MSNETSLIDRNGNAVAYIVADSDRTIYLWGGQPVAYLSGENVYGFNGRHLGWFIEGVMFGHDGGVLCTIRSKFPGVTSVEYVKNVKYVKYVKCVKEVPRVRPVFSNQFSATLFSKVFFAGM